MHMFDPTACDKATGPVSRCQTMNYSHAQKDLNSNEHLKSNLQYETLH